MRRLEVVSRTNWDDEEFGRGLVRLNAVVSGLVLGIMTGGVVCAATLWLVILGGDPVGPHLALLGQFFYGYSVSVVGSLVGLVYGAGLGFLIGWAVAWIYNSVVDMGAR